MTQSYRDVFPVTTYEQALLNRVAAAPKNLSQEEVARRLREDGVVKVAPRLIDQLNGIGRDSAITYIARKALGLGAGSSSDEHRGCRRSIKERTALVELADFLALVECSDSDYARSAKSLQENLTFIGEKEYKEATAGIASSWRFALDSNRDLQIHPVVGKIARPDAYNSNGATEQIKSDTFLLDSILSHFTEDDWVKYGGRVVIDPSAVAMTDKENLKVILLDDWILSGSQLGSAYSSFLSQHPDLRGSVEIQVVAAGEERISGGLSVRVGVRRDQVPVKSYFLAHGADDAAHGAFITGAYSSADYGFENSIAEMVISLRRQGFDVDMPPLTNIVRPYHAEEARSRLVHIERLRQLNSMHR